MINLRQFIDLLYKQKEIVKISYCVDPHLELAEIHRRVAAANGPALLFTNVKDSSFPVVTNLFGTPKRVSLAFKNRPEETIQEAVQLLTQDFPPSLKKVWQKRSLLKKMFRMGCKRARSAPVLQHRQATPDLEQLPLLKCWPLDGGHFITLPLVYTEPIGQGAPNLGMYRIERYGKKRCGLHWQISKGGGYHYHQAELENRALPVNIFIGGPPALMLSAITPLPENLPELLLCSLLQGEKLQIAATSHNNYPIVAESEFVLIGHAKPHEREREGPFGDHYGYYSLEHEFPVLHLEAIYHRKDAIYPATVVGKPRQEDFYLGNYLQKMLSPLFPVVMPGVKALWSYGETGFHSLSSAIVKERYYRECMASAFRILGEGQLSLTKFLLVTDQTVDLENFVSTLVTILERFTPETDLYIFANLSMDTLDYTGPALNRGSRAILLGIGEKRRDLPRAYCGKLPDSVRDLQVFCPGCLVVETDHFSDLLGQKELAMWPLVIAVDDVKKAVRSTDAFLWTVFTRFEPAADIYAKTAVHRHHLCYQLPIFIDARKKPSYPPEVLCDEKTAEKVTKDWHRYFPEGMDMGDSEVAHVC